MKDNNLNVQEFFLLAVKKHRENNFKLAVELYEKGMILNVSDVINLAKKIFEIFYKQMLKVLLILLTNKTKALRL